MNITVTHTIDPTALQLLQSFFTGMTVPSAKGNKKTQPQVTNGTEEPPVITIPEEAPAASAPKSELKLETIRALAQEKQQAGKRDGIKALVAEYGVSSVSAVPKENYEEFFQKLQAL